MYEDIYAKLGIQGPGPARCPSHDDNRESLQVNEGQRGLVMHCHVGCSVNEIMQAIGMPMTALFPPRPAREQASHIVATYGYHDELGKLLFEVVRFEPKSFRQRRPIRTKHDGSIQWDWKLGDVRRVLWRLPSVLDAIEEGAVVYVTEGEKDAEAVLAAGACATTNPGGAGKWDPDYTRVLCDAQVIVVADADPAGKKHAAQVAASLRRAGGSVSVVEPLEGFKDVAQHLGAGKTLDQLVPWHEGQLREPTPLRGDLWLVADFIRRKAQRMTWAVPGIVRTDSRVVIIGGEGHGKSVLLRQMAIASSQGIHPLTGNFCEPIRTMILDLENPFTDLREGLELLWLQAEKQAQAGNNPHDFDMTRCSVWHRAAGLDLRRRPDREEFEAMVEEARPALVVGGPIYKMFGGASEGDEDTFRPVLAWLDEVRDRYGFGLILEGHAPMMPPGQHHRTMRPFGSSVWLRWPDLGLGLTVPPGEDEFNPQVLKVTGWRGSRFKHKWPGEIVRGEARNNGWLWGGGDWIRGRPSG